MVVALGLVAASVCELHVRPLERVAAGADGDDLVDLWGSGVQVRELLVDPFAAEGAVGVVGEDSPAELGAAVAVAASWVALGHWFPSAFYGGPQVDQGRNFMRCLLVVVLVAGVVAGCTDDGDGLTAGQEESVSSLVEAGEESTGEAGDLDAALEGAEGVPDCSALPAPVDQAVLETGCFEGDELAFGGTYDCPDGSVVVIAGNRAGLEGGEWVDTDPDVGPFAWDLCP